MSQTRLRAYWATSILATLIYVLLVFLLLMVPGVEPLEKVWLLLPLIVLLTGSLIIGSWKTKGSKAPMTMWPLGPVIGGVLVLELVHCIIGIITQMLIILRKH